MQLVFEKFPDLEFEGRRLIWDSRQTPDGRKELVVLPPDLPQQLYAELRARKKAHFVGTPASGFDVETPDPREWLGEACARAAGNPSRRMKVLAVTGTNGKTSCVNLMRAAMALGGARVLQIGTLGLSVWDGQGCLASAESGYTTPEAPGLHKVLAEALADGITHLAIEASSHGIALGRLAGLSIDGALFTNLTQDHLDFHGTMQNYEEAKTRLFTRLLPRCGLDKSPVAVINTGDPAGRRIRAALPAALRAIEYERGRSYEILESSLEGLRLRMNDAAGAPFELRSRLVGAFNAENVVGACLLSQAVCDLASPLLARAMSEFAGVPGRLQRVPGRRKVFVDYAHTPDALAKVLAVVRGCLGPGARLSVVFGCGGDRDRAKRPLMGRIASEGADRVVVTSDNPRSEAPGLIIDEVVAAIAPERRGPVLRIEDRREAIRTAIRELGPGDVCVVAGRGHEAWQISGREKKPFSDAEVSAQILHQEFPDS